MIFPCTPVGFFGDKKIIDTYASIFYATIVARYRRDAYVSISPPPQKPTDAISII